MWGSPRSHTSNCICCVGNDEAATRGMGVEGNGLTVLGGRMGLLGGCGEDLLGFSLEVAIRVEGVAD